MLKAQSHNYTQKVAYNTIVQIVGKVVTTAISLYLITAITRYLGVAGYGQYTTIFAYVGFWAVFADFGFFILLVREISKPKADTNKVFNNIMTLRTVLSLVIFIVAFMVSWLIPSYSLVVKLGIGACAAGWFWISINSTYVGVFQANHKMQWAVLSDVIGRILILGFVLFFISKNMALNSLIWAYFIGNIINFFLSMIFARHLVHFKFAFDLNYWKKIFIEVWPIGIVLILSVLYFRTDTIMLSLFRTNTDVGIYGAPFKILEILLLVPGMFMGNVLPIITRYLNEKDIRFYPAVQKSFDFLCILAVPVVTGVFILATPIIKFIAGDDFINTATVGPYFGMTANSPFVLQILIISVGIYFISQLFNNIVIAIEKQKELVKPYIILSVLNVILNYIAIMYLSYVGAALISIFTSIFVLSATAKIVYHYHKLSLKYNILIKATISALIMGILVYLTKSHLFIAIGLGAVSYILCLYAFKCINKNTLTSLIGRNQ